MAKAPADGYTTVLASAGGLTANPSLYPNLGYNPLRDFAAITLFGTSPFALVAHPTVPANNARTNGPADALGSRQMGQSHQGIWRQGGLSPQSQ